MNPHIKRLVYSVLVLSILASPSSIMAQPFVYIPNSGESTVSVIDAATETVVATINVGLFPRAVAVNQSGTRAYVANSGDDSISVIDTATHTVVTTIQLVIGGTDPYSLVVHPDETRLYVANRFGGGKVVVIDTDTNTFIESVDVGSSGLWDIAIHPSGKYLFVTNSSDDTLSVIDTATNTSVQTVDTGDSPFGVSVHPNGKAVFVANSMDDTVSVFELADTSILQNKTTAGVNAPVVGADIARRFSDTEVVIVDPAPTTPLIQTGQRPTNAAVSPDGTRLYIPNSWSGSISVVELNDSPPFVSSPPIQTIATIGGNPEGAVIVRRIKIAENNDPLPRDRIFFGSFFTESVIPFTTDTLQAGTPIPVGPNPVVGPFSVEVALDVFNVLNSDVLFQQRRMSNTGTFLQPVEIIGPRLIRFGARQTFDLQSPADTNIPQARQLAVNGEDIQYKFFYRAGYGTPAYDTNPWVVAQDYSMASMATYEFPTEDNYIIIINAATDPSSVPTEVPIVGMNVNLAAGSEDVQVSGITANLPGGNPRAGEYVTVIVRATGPETIFYRFFYRAGYGTPAYDTNPWVNFRGFSPDNTATLQFPSADNYIVLAHAVADTDNIPTAIPVIGMNIVVLEAP